eukprot:8176503-Karenia_brevis.AAC.1
MRTSTSASSSSTPEAVGNGNEDMQIETRGQKRSGDEEIFEEDPRREGANAEVLTMTGRWGVDVTEVYSQPRVVPVAEKR